MRVLARLPSWLGDFVMAEPTVRALAAKLGAENLTLVAPAKLLSLFEGRFEGARRLPSESATSLADWRGHEAALLLNGSFRDAWRACRAGIPQRVAWATSARGPLLTSAIQPAREAGGTPLGVGCKGRYPRRLPRPFGSACAELAGFLGVPVKSVRPQLTSSESARDSVAARLTALDLEGPFNLINVGGRVGGAKSYPSELWREVLGRLDDAGEAGDAIPSVLVCGPGEESLARELDDAPGARAWLDPTADLAQLVALCERARQLITTDSGPRHIAVAVNTPVTAIFGPTDPRHTADQLVRTRILFEPAPCAPCHLEECPLVENNQRCMRAITPNAVTTSLRSSR